MTTALHRGGAPSWAKAFAAFGWLVTVASGIGALGLRVADPVPVVPNLFGMDYTRMVVFVILFLAAVAATLASITVTAIIGLSGYGAAGIPLAIYGVSSTFIPVSIAIAILRHGLYDIDHLISRSLAYAVVTGILATLFAATAIGLSTLLGTLADGDTLAVAGSTLLVVALFGPLRRRAQTAIDRRFDRARYDAALTVQAMTARLRDDVDLDRVQSDVLGVIDRTFHPAKAGLWLR